MGLPTILKGTSHIGKNSKEEILSIIDVNVERQRSNQAGFRDSAGKIWFVKELSKEEALRETLAGNYFQFLTDKDSAPETRFLVGEDGKYYVMSAFTTIKEINPAEPPQKLALIISASYAIRDGDCLPKNVKVVNGNAFRIDFGCALIMQDGDNLDIPLITSINQLRTGFQTRYFKGKLNDKDFINAAESLRSRKLDAFHWQDWEHLANDNESLKIFDQRRYIEQRIQVFCAHLLDNKNNIDERLITQTPKEEIEKLSVFYKLLMEENVSEGDFIFIRLDPKTLAYRHIEYVNQYGKTPKIFEERVLQAYQKKSMPSFASLLSNLPKKPNSPNIDNTLKELDSKNKCNQLDNFCIDQLDAKKRGIDVKRFEQQFDMGYLTNSISSLLKDKPPHSPSTSNTTNAAPANSPSPNVDSKKPYVDF